jgi:hypothetical protein
METREESVMSYCVIHHCQNPSEATETVTSLDFSENHLLYDNMRCKSSTGKMIM